jgi:hypothetical protein
MSGAGEGSAVAMSRSVGKRARHDELVLTDFDMVLFCFPL